MIAGDASRGYERTDEIEVIQVFLHGSSAEVMRLLDRELAPRLEERCRVKATDLVVPVVPTGRDDWSPGLGPAQFLEGDV